LWGFVPDFHFTGRSDLALDAKGRLTVPAKHREVIAAQALGRLTITRNPDGWLMLFPQPEWEKFAAQVAALPLEAMAWRRMYFGHATPLEIDNGSRILISPELRACVGLERDVVLLGNGSHLELWDKQRHAEHEATLASVPKPPSVLGLVY
jgi:MraZ protein